jgi:RNA polymerase sigma factor (sigma-70 family)
LAAVSTRGRANRVEGQTAPEADATRALYERYANQIFGYCLHQLGTREEAEDAVQSTFLNAFRGLKRGIVPELESAWLFTIAHNVCLSRRRSSWRRGRIESPADFELVEELTPAPARRADELIGLQDALGQMPETQRRAILLREWQGLSYREIAEELDVSQSAVETLIFRARRALAGALEQPPRRPRRSIARVLDWGNAVTAVKSLLVGGSAAAKVAATVAVVSATTVAAAGPLADHGAHARSREPAPQTAPHRRAAPAVPRPRATAPAAVTPAAPVRLRRPSRVARPHAVHPSPVRAARSHLPATAPVLPVPPVETDSGTPPPSEARLAHAGRKDSGAHSGTAGPGARERRGRSEKRADVRPGKVRPAPVAPVSAAGTPAAPGDGSSAHGNGRSDEHGPRQDERAAEPQPEPVEPGPTDTAPAVEPRGRGKGLDK